MSAIDQVENGDSGLDARGKINAVIDKLNSGVFAPNIEYLGSEIVEDGDLATDPTALDPAWVLGEDCTYSTGQIVSTVENNDPAFSVPISTVEGNTYFIEIHQTISGDATGVYLDNTDVYFASSADVALFVFTATYTGEDSLWIDFDSYNEGALRTVTSVSVREISPVADGLSVLGYDGTPLFGMGRDLLNVAIGRNALRDITVGTKNVAVGENTLSSNTTGDNNVALGSGALAFSTTGGGNTAVGINALSANTTGFANTGIGGSALYNNITGYSNIGIGGAAGGSITSGHDNICIGPADVPSGSTNYYLNIGDVIKGDMENGPIEITKPLKIAGATPASALAAGVAGTIVWDGDYVYICVATNTWKRAALDTWS